jgi:hypothetical protein
VISENPGEVEVAITLKPYSESISSPSDLWDEFIISSLSGEDRWTEHCRGLVSVQTPAKVANVIDGESQKTSERSNVAAMIDNYNQNCPKEVKVPQFYETIAKLGLEYGETFACITEARSGPNLCIGRITIPDTAAVMPQQHEFPFVIHPTTLDSLFHTIFVALDADHMKDPAIPVSVDEIFVSSAITRIPGDQVVCYTSTEKKDSRSVLASLVVVEADASDTNTPVVRIGGINCARLEVAESQDSSSENTCRAYNIIWKPDIDMALCGDLSMVLHGTQALDRINMQHKLEIAAFCSLKSLIHKMESELLNVTSVHQPELFGRLQNIVEKTTQGNMGSLSEDWILANEAEHTALLDELKSDKSGGQTLLRLFELLPGVLKGALPCYGVYHGHEKCLFD